MLHRLMRAATTRVTNAWPVKSAVCRLSAPVVSFTFDDFPHSAWTQGACVLEKYGARATFFISAAFAPDNLRSKTPAGPIEGVRYYELSDVIAAHSNGHEIGCHSFDHRNAPLQSDADLERSIFDNARFVKDLLGDVIMTSFAFPQGRVNIRAKRLFSRHFSVCRGTWPGINAGLLDLSLLRSFGIDAESSQAYPVEKLIDMVRARNGWLIFNTHDVGHSPSRWGCTPELLDSIVSKVIDHGIEILPIKHALARAIFH
jgi:peptidoglycan/xylan/chitin deacetylase (PgdA/CDA1 family)